MDARRLILFEHWGQSVLLTVPTALDLRAAYRAYCAEAGAPAGPRRVWLGGEMEGFVAFLVAHHGAQGERLADLPSLTLDDLTRDA